MSKTRVLISVGGTGGHIFPARALAEYLQDKAEVFYLEKKIISSSKNLFKILAGSLQALKVMLKFKPQVVIVTGGYPAVPVGLAAFCLRKPLVLMEQNAFLGKTNRF
ncbi:MAG: glycosyltransferase, partial [Candidatus Margulisiibacteriota bacterium]